LNSHRTSGHALVTSENSEEHLLRLLFSTTTNLATSPGILIELEVQNMTMLTVCGYSSEVANWQSAADHLTEQIIDEYVRRRLNGAELDLVEEHLLFCHRCVQETELTLLVIETLRLHSIGAV
jgi:hypothetical protein